MAKLLLVKVFLPFVPNLSLMSGNVEKPGKARPGGFIDKFHPRFPGSPARLTPVTEHAGTDNVLPGMLSSPVTGNNVVKGKLFGFFAAILADVPVTLEYFEPGQPSVNSVRSPYHRGEPDYRWYREITTNRVDKAGTVLQHLRLVLINEHHRPPHATNVKRLIALIQHQNRTVNHKVFFIPQA